MINNVTRAFSTLAEFAPDWISPPGDAVAGLLEERGWTQDALALRTGLASEHVGRLLSGEASIQPDVALRLEKVLGGSATFWLRLEAQYQEQLSRRKASSAA